MLKKLFLLLFFLNLFPSVVSSQNIDKYSDKVWWHGTANFLGKVVSPACSLDMDDRYQRINLGVIPIGNVNNGEPLVTKKFELKLMNCQFATDAYNKEKIKGLTVVFYSNFSGNEPSNFLFNNNEYVYFNIETNNGIKAKANYPLPLILIDGENKKLIFRINVMQKDNFLKLGKYNSVILFKVAYE